MECYSSTEFQTIKWNIRWSVALKSPLTRATKKMPSGSSITTSNLIRIKVEWLHLLRLVRRPGKLRTTPPSHAVLCAIKCPICNCNTHSNSVKTVFVQHSPWKTLNKHDFHDKCESKSVLFLYLFSPLTNRKRMKSEYIQIELYIRSEGGMAKVEGNSGLKI